MIDRKTGKELPQGVAEMQEKMDILMSNKEFRSLTGKDMDEVHSSYWLPQQKSMVELMKEAQEIVQSKPLFKSFIQGTPLENDIAVWMADFVVSRTEI